MKKGSKKIYIAIVAVLALVVALLLIFRTKGEEETEEREVKVLSPKTEVAYKAVPSDAVLIFDFEQLDHIAPLLRDTSNYFYGLIDPSSELVKFQKRLVDLGAGNCHTLYSLHYSAINEVTLLQIADLSDASSKEKIIHYLDSIPHTRREYNQGSMRVYDNGFKVAVKDNYLLASTSTICVEGSLRHLANGSSVLDNQEFYSMLRRTGGDECLYVNHKQIGKLFSGSVTYGFLKYSDFIMRMATWSALMMNPRQKNFISFEGYLKGNEDLINFSTVLSGQKGESFRSAEILPASTMFAICLNISAVKGYLKDFQKYLDANKKISSYAARMERVTLLDAPAPLEWVASEGFTEFVSAFILVGNKYEWMTFAYHNSQTWLNKMTGIKGKREITEPQPYIYKGYLEALFGESFSHTQEDMFCKVGDWTVIGSAPAVAEFAKGKASMVSLEDYLSHTPASSFFSDKAAVKAFANIKEGSDTLFTVLNKYYRKRFTSSIQKKNFEYATLSVTPKGKDVLASLNFYAARLSEVPQLFNPEEGGNQVFIDSTIKTFFGPFPLVENGDTTWFEQSQKWLSVSYQDRNHKGIWGIPMKDTIKNYASLVTMPDEKKHIMFILGNKLYAMSRRGAHYTGYPKELDCGVALGPKVVTEKGETRLMILTDENIVTKRDLEGKRVSGWEDIHADEFTRTLPEEIILFDQKYLILRTVGKTRIYLPNGEEVTAKNLKRPISKESPIVEVEDGFVKVMGVDGKEFLFNLRNGRIKKL